MLNSIHKKRTDSINLEELIELYKQMIQIDKDYLIYYIQIYIQKVYISKLFASLIVPNKNLPY